MHANNAATCQQCSGSLKPIGTYDEYVSHASNAQDERKIIYGYFMQKPEAAFQQFLQCDTCGFKRIDPLPDVNVLTDFYQHYYGNSRYAPKAEKKIRRTRKRLKSLTRKTPNGTFLDVGCNLGFAVEAARRVGFSASGIEIDAEAVAYAQQHYPQNTFTATTIADYQSAVAYDVVYCTEVIEHVVDTVDFAKNLARLTRPGGYLYLTTPDAGHWRRPARFIAWPEVKPPEHVNWQTRKSMTKLLTDAGFMKPNFAFKMKPGMTLIARRGD